MSSTETDPRVYVTPDEFKETHELLPEVDDEDIPGALSAASRVVDDIAGAGTVPGRRFWADDELNLSEPDTWPARLYRPWPQRATLAIDDVFEVVSIEAGSGSSWRLLTVDTDYELEPLNAALDDRPWDTIRFARYRWLPGYVRVTGRFGWPEVPDVVVEATKIIAAKILKRKTEAPLGFAFGIEGATAHIRRTDPTIEELLRPVTRTEALIR